MHMSITVTNCLVLNPASKGSITQPTKELVVHTELIVQLLTEQTIEMHIIVFHGICLECLKQGFSYVNTE